MLLKVIYGYFFSLTEEFIVIYFSVILQSILKVVRIFEQPTLEI